MKKVLIAISLLLVFGITSAAIKLGGGVFGSSASSGGWGGSGGSGDVVRLPGVARSGSSDGGAYSIAHGSGMGGNYLLTGVLGRNWDESSNPLHNEGPQDSGSSFNNGSQRPGDTGWGGNGYVARDDAVVYGSRYAYSPQAGNPGFAPLGGASPGRNDGSIVTMGSSDSPVQPVPEPETYAMLLAGLGLIGAAARRRGMRRV